MYSIPECAKPAIDMPFVYYVFAWLSWQLIIKTQSCLTVTADTKSIMRPHPVIILVRGCHYKVRGTSDTRSLRNLPKTG